MIYHFRLGKKNLSFTNSTFFKIYLCGPTVYNDVHIGNLRPVFIFDVIVRFFKEMNIKYKYVHNITDIDDKIIKKSADLKVTELELTNYFTQEYFEILEKSNVIFPDEFPRVSAYIEEMKNSIFSLLEKGYAYENKDIFFNISKIESYGNLSNKKIKMNKNIRLIKNNEGKFNDFILWKKTDNGINWNSKWGKGRPGWHIECSTIIDKTFKCKTIDIHGGGSDLLFPHHENENALFFAMNSTDISKHWIHISTLNFNGKKMSKSVGNIFLAKDFLKSFDSNVLKHIFFASNYRKSINLNDNVIKQSVNYVNKISNFVKKIKIFVFVNKNELENELFLSKVNDSFFLEKKEAIFNSILDDVNTSAVLFHLEDVINFMNKIIDSNEKSKDLPVFVNYFKFFKFILRILGLKFDFSDYSRKVSKLLCEWFDKKKNRNYHDADIIREKLENIDVL